MIEITEMMQALADNDVSVPAIEADKRTALEDAIQDKDIDDLVALAENYGGFTDDVNDYLRDAVHSELDAYDTSFNGSEVCINLANHQEGLCSLMVDKYAAGRGDVLDEVLEQLGVELEQDDTRYWIIDPRDVRYIHSAIRHDNTTKYTTFFGNDIVYSANSEIFAWIDLDELPSNKKAQPENLLQTPTEYTGI